MAKETLRRRAIRVVKAQPVGSPLRRHLLAALKQSYEPYREYEDHYEDVEQPFPSRLAPTRVSPTSYHRRQREFQSVARAWKGSISYGRSRDDYFLFLVVYEDGVFWEAFQDGVWDGPVFDDSYDNDRPESVWRRVVTSVLEDDGYDF